MIDVKAVQGEQPGADHSCESTGSSMKNVVPLSKTDSDQILP